MGSGPFTHRYVRVHSFTSPLVDCRILWCLAHAELDSPSRKNAEANRISCPGLYSPWFLSLREQKESVSISKTPNRCWEEPWTAVASRFSPGWLNRGLQRRDLAGRLFPR